MAVVNTKPPECGELLLTQAILAFLKGYQHRYPVGAVLSLLGHLFNQGLAHEFISPKLVTALLDEDAPVV